MLMITQLILWICDASPTFMNKTSRYYWRRHGNEQIYLSLTRKSKRPPQWQSINSSLLTDNQHENSYGVILRWIEDGFELNWNQVVSIVGNVVFDIHFGGRILNRKRFTCGNPLDLIRFRNDCDNRCDKSSRSDITSQRNARQLRTTYTWIKKLVLVQSEIASLHLRSLQAIS